MSREKMELARGLIQQHHYAEARSILQTVDDPKAREWLVKLDKIRPQPPPKKPISKVLLIAVIFSFVSVLVAIIVLIFVLSYQSSVKKTNELLTLYCMEVDRTALSETLRPDCMAITNAIMADKELSAIAKQCANDHGDNWDRYKICADEILPTAKRQRSEQRSEQLHANDQAQVAIFYNYCSNASTLISTDYSDKECLAWTWQVSNSYPGDSSSTACWGVPNVNDIRLEAAGKEANALACIERKVGIKMPPVPACDASHPKRLSCVGGN